MNKFLYSLFFITCFCLLIFIGVEAVDMAAVGDSFNDLPMLLSSGLSIAMGDAPDQVKAAADFVAPTVEEDGLALAIREHILPRVYGRT